MKHLFIINPAAGRKDRSQEISEEIRTAFAGTADPSDTCEIYITKGPMDAADRIRTEAASSGPLRVYACGGDGTLNECVNGAALLPNAAVTHFPCGTGNDFIKIFGNERKRFFDLNELIHGEVRPYDLIETCGRYSINICSIGLDARIAADVHKYSNIPVIGGATGYVVSLIVNIFKGLSQPLRFSGCGYEYEGKATLICACNGQYYGGGFHPFPQARPDNGNLDFLFIKEIHLWEFPSLIGKYAAGRWEELPKDKIVHLQGDHLQIESPADIVVNIDGEAIFRKSVNFDLVPKGVNFIVPKGITFAP
jgi:YegS/Rv2252/BmrU family lipid kinase